MGWSRYPIGWTLVLIQFACDYTKTTLSAVIGTFTGIFLALEIVYRYIYRYVIIIINDVIQQ